MRSRSPLLSRCTLWALSALLAVPGSAAAAEPMTLVVLQAAKPFSVMRAEQVVPPARELPVAKADVLRTGVNGRGSLRFGVALMTLGPEAEALVEDIQQPAGGFNGRLDLKLVRGALRIDGSRERRLPQDIRLTLTDLRLRVFGADVWAESSAERRSVCLLSGAVEIVTVSGAERLEEPGDCLIVDATGLHRQSPDRPSMNQKLALTDYSSVSVAPPAKPAPPQEPPRLPPVTAETAQGWMLVAAALGDAESAALEVQGLIDQGLPGVVRIFDPPNGKRVYRVTIGSFATRAQAEAFAADVKQRFGMTQIWVAPY